MKWIIVLYVYCISWSLYVTDGHSIQPLFANELNSGSPFNGSDLSCIIHENPINIKSNRQDENLHTASTADTFDPKTYIFSYIMGNSSIIELSMSILYYIFTKVIYWVSGHSLTVCIVILFLFCFYSMAHKSR